MKDKILRRPQVEELTGLPRSTIYQRMATGQFPRPIKLGGENSRSVGWPESQVLDWLEQRTVATGNQSATA